MNTPTVKYKITIIIPAPLLNEGLYHFDFVISAPPLRLDEQKGIIFEVIDKGSFVSFVRKGKRGGSICIPLKWEIEFQ